jgi:DNA-binding MarR family transcriptional regulator
VEIARNLFRELHSVTEMLKRMEKDGLIMRYKASGRSRVEVKLTEKGLDVFNQ